MNSARALTAAGILLVLATVCGAFGAHALKAHLSAERLQLWETAVRYQFFHSLGLMGIALTMRTLDGTALHLAALLVVIGVVLFCGSLYLLALGGPRVAGVLTPLGGLAWIAGWLVFVYAVWR